MVLRMSVTGRSYTQNFFKLQCIIIQAILSRKSIKSLLLPMKKYSVSFRLLTVKNSNHADMRTSHTQFLGKGCQLGEEDSKNKILSYKEYITIEKVKIIEITFLFCLPAG